VLGPSSKRFGWFLSSIKWIQSEFPITGKFFRVEDKFFRMVMTEVHMPGPKLENPASKARVSNVIPLPTRIQVITTTISFHMRACPLAPRRALQPIPLRLLTAPLMIKVRKSAKINDQVPQGLPNRKHQKNLTSKNK
jgi:hypothetical protein